jgi:uncharacterized protein YjbI with pentapeptide repeats
MNKYVRKLFGVMFHGQQTQQAVRIQSQPSPTSPEEWRQHWLSRGQPWRTEPEIDTKRQEELSKCRAIVPDIEKGIYPFKGLKLSRADVEWLLATHENGLGPVDWSDENQRVRKGLDLRGADLRKANLSGLPLARLGRGLTSEEWGEAEEQMNMAAVLLEGANLTGAQLQEAELRNAKLQRANLVLAELQGATLLEAELQGAHLLVAKLQGASLVEAKLQGADLRQTDLTDATLHRVTLSDEKYGTARLADVHWSNSNLAVVDWGPVKRLGDELVARRRKDVHSYREAVRAYRQLAVELQNQGLNEDSARFAFRAQILQRKVLWKQRNFWKWLGSAILALLAGYGYRMWRILAAYVLIVLLCAGAYFVLGLFYEPHLSFLDALLTSIMAFHGRVFSEPFLHPGVPQLWVTAFEAIAGLVIEGVFIAMLTQKFFGK